jgi:AcrR family transcriptional regulator
MVVAARQDWKTTWRSQKKKGLLDAVVGVLAREGIEGLTMDNVALEAGVAKGTLYAYFNSKRNLLRAAIEASIAPLVEDLRAILTSNLPPDEKLRSMTHHHLSYFDENRSFFQILLYDRTAAQERLKRYRSFRYHDLLEAVGGVIQNGIKQGLFRPIDPLKTAAMLIESNIAIINQRLLCENPEPVQEDSRLLTDTFLFGIAEEGLRKKRVHS